MRTDDPRHGTYAGYNAGCRLQCCRDAAARYQRGLDWDRHNGITRTVPVVGSRRRLEALMALGWYSEELSQMLGYSRAWLNVITRGDGPIYLRNARKIADLYDRLSMQLPPEHKWRGRQRAMARRKGWAVPLAWDDDTIDDPAAKPRGGSAKAGVDPVVVERILAGDWRLPATRAERAEVIRRWSGSLNELARLTHWNVARDTRLEGVRRAG